MDVWILIFYLWWFGCFLRIYRLCSLVIRIFEYCPKITAWGFAWIDQLVLILLCWTYEDLIVSEDIIVGNGYLSFSWYYSFYSFCGYTTHHVFYFTNFFLVICFHCNHEICSVFIVSFLYSIFYMYFDLKNSFKIY